MDAISYKTAVVNKAGANKKWLVIDAEGQVLGRMASEVAKRIRGKHKASFTPNADCGDFVIVINADKIKLTGEKWVKKQYISHSGYPGGQKIKTAEEVYRKDPTRLVEAAVRGMLPKNRLGRAIFKNLHVYNGAEHPHDAQKPEAIKL